MPDFDADLNDFQTAARLLHTASEFGAIMEFGRYPQDSDGEIMPIKWLILHKNAGRVLLLSQWGLDSIPFSDRQGQSSWSRCSLRRWLNSDFCSQAFTNAELSRIETVRLHNPANPLYDTVPDADTEDRIFLLSPLDVENYLERRDYRLCMATPYAQRCGSDMYAGDEERFPGFYAWWWLRWPGYYGNASYMYSSGDIFNDFAVDNQGGTVRPALWLKRQ